MGTYITMIANVVRKYWSAEAEQAVIRLVIGTLGFVYSLEAAVSGRATTSLVDVFVFGGVFLTAAIIILIRVCIQGSMTTRLSGIVLDIGAVSYLISLLHEPGFLLLPIYLWVIVGNGLRYGFGYLLVSTVLSVPSLVWVFTYGHTWTHSLYMAAAWLLALLVLPVYFGVLLQRLKKQASELENLSQRMETLAKHDALTALPNRSAFYERIKDEMKRADARGLPFAMAFVDLDGFKVVNDNYGHDVGDAVIKSASTRISDSVRTDDFVARLGGDEFVVLLPCHNADKANVSKAVKKILVSLAVPFDAGSQTITLSASIGVAFYPRDGKDLESLLRCADKEMYNVKRAGKNGYRIATG